MMCISWVNNVLTFPVDSLPVIMYSVVESKIDKPLSIVFFSASIGEYGPLLIGSIQLLDRAFGLNPLVESDESNSLGQS